MSDPATSDIRTRPRSASAPRPVRVLDVDPDLASALPKADVKRARAELVARPYEAASGPWEIHRPASESGAFGLLVLDGLLGLRTSIGARATLELVGRGDLLQPWVQLDSESSMPPTAGWRVIEPAKLLLLDRRFAEAAAQWPEVTAALMHRLVLRSRRLCYQLAVNTSPRVEERVLFALWALADRWGRVTEEGTVLQLHLTHQQVAELVAAQRPSVSGALSRLREEGRLTYTRDCFTLLGQVPGEVETLKEQVALLPAV